MFKQYFLYWHQRSLPLVLSMRRVWLCHLSTLRSGIYTHGEDPPLSLLFSRLNPPSSLSLSFYDRCSNALIHLCSPLSLLGFLQYDHVSIVLGSPKQDPVSHQCRAEGSHHRFPCFSDSLSNAAQDAVDHLCHKSTLMVHGKLGVHQHPRSFSDKLLSSQSVPSLYWCMRLFLPRGRSWNFVEQF